MSFRQLGVQLLGAAEILERLGQGYFFRKPGGFVFGCGVAQVFRQLLPQVLPQRSRPDAAANLVQVLLKFVHQASPECDSPPGTALPTIVSSPSRPFGPRS